MESFYGGRTGAGMRITKIYDTFDDLKNDFALISCTVRPGEYALINPKVKDKNGTIYPDILESDGVKAHHNVGGLPEDIHFEGLVEPVKFLYKDEVRAVGKALGLPDSISLSEPQGGLFIWATLPDGADMNAFCKAAVQRKVAVVPGIAFCADESAPSQSFRLNYSTPTDEQIDEGVKILCETTKDFLK